MHTNNINSKTISLGKRADCPVASLPLMQETGGSDNVLALVIFCHTYFINLVNVVRMIRIAARNKKSWYVC